MTAYIVGAVVALAAAGFCFWQAREASARRARLLLTETSSTGLLRELQAAATAAAGPGSFAELVELEGVAVAGPRGLLTSEISRTACVWHRHEITRKYRDVDHDSKGRRQTTTKEEVVTENSTQEPFGLRDADGEITIVPTVDVDHVRKSVSEFRESHERNDSTIKVGSFSFSIPSGGDGDTLGYTYEEWVLEPDTRIFVQGEARDRGGELEVVEPRGKHSLAISTRSEEALLDDAAGDHRLYTWLGAGAVVVAVILVVLGFTVGS